MFGTKFWTITLCLVLWTKTSYIIVFICHAWGKTLNFWGIHSLRLQVANSRGVVGAHRCTTDCIANRLSRGESRTAPAQGYCRWIVGRDSHVIRRWRGCCRLVSGRWMMQANCIFSSHISIWEAVFHFKLKENNREKYLHTQPGVLTVWSVW